jgi:hypothetical protein
LKSSSLAAMCVLGEESRIYMGSVESCGGVWEKTLSLDVKLERDKSGAWTLDARE